MRNKKTRYTTILTVALALSFTSCVKDELSNTPHPDKGAVIVTTDWSAKSTDLGDVSGDSALVGVATGLLGGSGEAVLTEDVDSGVHIALSLNESLLALHHRRVGHLAELLDHSGGDLSHVRSFRRKLPNGVRLPTRQRPRWQEPQRPSRPRRSAPCRNRRGKRRRTARS